MFFVTGTPTRISARLASSDGFEQNSLDDDFPVHAVGTADGRLIGVLSRRSATIWATKPHALLAKTSRSTLTVLEDGVNSQLVFNRDGSSFVVVTDKGYLHFYSLVFDSMQGLVLDFASGTHTVNFNPGDRDGLVSTTIIFRMALEIDTGVACAVGLNDELLLCTRDSPSLLSLSWSGKVNDNATTSLGDLSFLQDSTEMLSQMTSNDANDVFAWTDSAGRAYISQKLSEVDPHEAPSEDSDEFGEEKLEWAGICFYDLAESDVLLAPATSIAINSRFLLIAVGDDK
ncbi:hypothetical protein BC830DRAFT_1169573 [Chytriomyces sp. MP71]|nr:hypothetical protein BC830DRAFT_1169573 [Chytriomyces sp. MP71]